MLKERLGVGSSPLPFPWDSEALRCDGSWFTRPPNLPSHLPTSLLYPILAQQPPLPLSLASAHLPVCLGSAPFTLTSNVTPQPGPPFPL
jgi:hypothetical protein